MRKLLYAILCLTLISCDETSESYIPTYDAATRSKAMKNGWLPVWLPETALDIHEWHDLDTNRTLVAFRFATSDTSSAFVSCVPTTPRPNPGGRSWWPADTTWKRLRFHECPERVEGGDGHTRMRAAWVAVDVEGTRAYFWR